MRDKYAFAIDKRIIQVFTDSFLYLDGINNVECYEECSVRRIDKPLFLFLEDGTLVRLHGTSLSVCNEVLKEYVFCQDFHRNIQTQRAFQFLCGRSITSVQEFETYYNYEDETDNFHDPAEPIKPGELSDIAVVLDNGIRLVCNMFFDYFDIRIVE